MDKSQETALRALTERIVTFSGKIDSLNEILDLPETAEFRASLQAMIEGIVTFSGKTDFLNEISNVSGEGGALLQSLLQVVDERNEFLRKLNELRDTGIDQFLAETQVKLQKEVDQNVASLTNLRNSISSKMRNTLEGDRKFAKETAERRRHDLEELIHAKPTGNRDRDEGMAELTKGFGEANLEWANTSQSIMEINRLAYQLLLKQVDSWIDALRGLFRDYRRERIMLGIKQEAIRIFFLLIILTLGVGIFFSLIPVWWLSLLLLPTIAWFLTDHYIQPYLEKRLFTPRKRHDLRALLIKFYYQSILARCSLAFVKALAEKLGQL